MDQLPLPMYEEEGNNTGGRKRRKYNSTSQQIKDKMRAGAKICPLCHLNPEFKTEPDGDQPLIKLATIANDVMAANQCNVADACLLIHTYWKSNVEKEMVNVEAVKHGVRGRVSHVKWSPEDILYHFTYEQPVRWVSLRENLDQVRGWKAELAEYSSYEEGAPDLNNIKVWELLERTESRIYDTLEGKKAAASTSKTQEPIKAKHI